MNKWYVVGKIGGFIGAIKMFGLLAVGFCVGVLAMDKSEERKKQKHAKECDAYNQGWNDYHRYCADLNRNEENGEYEFGASKNAGT